MNFEDINLKKIRKERGYTQNKLANLLGIKQSHLSRIETGKRNPNKEVIKKYHNIFGSSLNLPTSVQISTDRPGIALLHKLIERYDYMSNKALDALYQMTLIILENDLGITIPKVSSLIEPNEVSISDDRYRFNMRDLYKYLTTRPILKNIPFTRLMVRRSNFLSNAQISDSDYEMFTKGTFGGGVMELVAGGDEILARDLKKTHPTGGVFNYHKEKANRNIGPSTDIWSLTCYLTLENRVEIFIRYQSDYEYTLKDQKMVLNACYEFFTKKGIKVIQSSESL